MVLLASGFPLIMTNHLPLHFHENTVVLQGIEAWISRDAAEQDADAAAIRMKWQEIIKEWQIWEAAKEHRRCILIGADITKGIVPIEAETSSLARCYRLGFSRYCRCFKPCRCHLVWSVAAIKIKEDFIMKIYTRTGDKGQTSVIGGRLR